MTTHESGKKALPVHWTPLRAALLTLTLLLALEASALATQFRANDAVRIRGEDILDDLFVAGGDVSVDARIVGDLFATGATVLIGDSALVENSLMAAGRRVDLYGHIVNSARFFAQDVNVRGHIERNLMAFSATLILDGSGWVENDISVFCGEVIIRGPVGGTIDGTAGRIVIAGKIDGDVNIKADEITILPSAIIGGDLKYTSPNEAKIEDGATILGTVTRLAATAPTSSGYAFGDFLWDAWLFLAKLAVGLVLLALFKPFITQVKNTALESSLKSLGVGFLFLVCIPVAVGVLVITLLGIPLAALVLISWFMLVYLAKVFVGLATGEWLLARLYGGRTVPAALSMAVGLLLLTLVSMIPVAGILVRLMIVSLGFGAFLIAAYRARTQTHPPTT